ncbi:MAG: sensor domain-containing diguanylate cyclase, partial [Betaproteobacteria bacterium]
MYRPFVLHRPLSPPLAWLGLALLIFAACLVGIFARPIGFLSVFWPANALLLGLLVRYPRLARPPAWVAAAVGYVAADLVTGSTWSMALWLNGANLLGATAGWLVLRRLDERIRRLQRTISALYLLLAALAASAVGALAGCGAAPVYFNSPWTDLLSLWFSTELMNYMLIVPVVLAAPRAD